MSTDENKAIVRRFNEAISAQRTDVFDEVATLALAQFCKDGFSWAQATYGDHQIAITDMVAEGDVVMARLILRGGHTGEWEGIPPTGKQWAIKLFAYYRLGNGKIVELDFIEDHLDRLKQLGATITPPAQRTV